MALTNAERQRLYRQRKKKLKLQKAFNLLLKEAVDLSEAKTVTINQLRKELRKTRSK